jgi:hypothetical protein
VGATFGTARPASPAITIPDRTSKRLGANTSNKTLFAALRREEWTSVVYGAVPPATVLMRNLAASAGCHLYSQDGSVKVIARSGQLALQADRPGTYRISLPGPHDVTDVWTGALLARGATEFEATISETRTALFVLRGR